MREKRGKGREEERKDPNDNKTMKRKCEKMKKTGNEMNRGREKEGEIEGENEEKEEKRGENVQI